MIQYAAANPISRRRWLLDAPLSRGMTPVGVCRCRYDRHAASVLPPPAPERRARRVAVHWRCGLRALGVAQLSDRHHHPDGNRLCAAAAGLDPAWAWRADICSRTAKRRRARTKPAAVAGNDL